MRRLLLSLMVLLSLTVAGAAHAELRKSKYVVTISSKPTMTLTSPDGTFTGGAQAEWTGRWFVTMYTDRQRETAAFKATATAADTLAKKRSTFVGTAKGAVREHLYGDYYRDCSWETTAKTAISEVSLTGKGLDGLRGGKNRSYHRSKVIGMWLEASGPTGSSFGTCTSASGTATPKWEQPQTAFLNADQCAFGTRDDLDGTETPKAIKIGFSAKNIGAKLIKSKAAGFPADQASVLGLCSPFGQQFAAGQTSNAVSKLDSGYVFEMKRLQ